MKTTLHRDEYGAIYTSYSTNDADKAAYTSAMALVKLAAKKGKLPQAYDDITRDRKGRFDGDALHHEIYDFTQTAVLVCVREAEGTKYGVKTTSKSYYIVRKHGRGVVVADAPKSKAAKAAKECATLGHAIAVCIGKGKLKSAAALLEWRTGYKLVERTEEPGVYKSCWDDSEWKIGKLRREKATYNHNGGFYYYRDLAEALEAAQYNSVFRPSMNHRKLAVLLVEVAGNEYRHDNGKLCSSMMRPISDIATTI